MKINWKPVKDFAELICGVACYGLLVTAYRKIGESPSVTSDRVSARYDEAVGAIMSSGMYSHDKVAAITALKRNAGAEFYGAIIHIAEDDCMYSHDKVDMIKALSEK